MMRYGRRPRFTRLPALRRRRILRCFSSDSRLRRGTILPLRWPMLTAITITAITLTALRSISAVRTLEPLLPVSAIETLIPIAAITIPAVATVLITAAVLLPISIALPVAAMVVLPIPTFMPRTRPAIVETLTVMTAFAAFMTHRLVRRLGRHVDAHCAHVVAVIVSELVAHSRVAEPAGSMPWHGRYVAATLRHLLFAEGQDDPIVMLSMLEIVFGQHGIAARLSIPRQSHILLGDMSRSTAQLHVRPRALEAPSKRVLPLAVRVIVVVVITSASSAVLLSLPHGLHSRWLKKDISGNDISFRT
jgi:hypothetical protein